MLKNKGNFNSLTHNIRLWVVSPKGGGNNE